MKEQRTYELAGDARGQLEHFDVYVQRIIVDSLRQQLVDADPATETVHKGILKEPVGDATHKIEIRAWRAYYKIERAADVIRSVVLIIGEKRGNKLFVEGKEYPT
ncbi:MAG: hypothetical protein A3G34_13250 [Candidatus Lindowbacteria bacterium RIFCSPLOWO2_12_FULL_62_27]|nr:MAG: hypothetical protein A3I06_14815 [Candidatus Lindowbacteria bacterium RIFCSPLOWO2_02_FULL_62_12]OGH62550.1 MAG: hypothetical protein A3G34_13250 [Candidatus Lindowbacteria bacterium RIFCSPLOWO2_12_FULL_62_27]